MTWMVGAIICGLLIMAFVLACAVITICLCIAAARKPPAEAALIIDPEKPEQALNEAGQLVAVAKVGRP